ncbi:Transcription initiation factor IIF subunit alpha [Heracleum sosnowskyi]|uniref:Transcription initiation factor IIF subunit alpha n=1 Tax=Heracleum sosnowskyi TaxID=360622 RepID=A0AAD8IMQ1_9APIA|nr:Transcription initiation factor IIF subunit alpha [Heracleum sosnowskyi]KAK1387838.1 Transcription initiation factor IIF subunit alpha [Heracleum sosnowskyi]KAK1387839.1 Transcription initiation factor IIF subunit alpha [Heracleum sosnowskyi]KAK1387841.1 Transcription initiation factor IIF subunit alpha [Heracleum sosnowskyi]KAK1387843.1 Transcription initiation factor IIF subunit alpha [Heracleum sosnowskyi]
MSGDLILKSSCRICKSMTELYGSNCKHLTLCVSCGKSMAEKGTKCHDCGAPITRLIREYNVRACSSTDKNYFIGKFVSGLPDFSKGCIEKEGVQGRQLCDEKYKNKPWVLEDETGQFRYHGVLEGALSATYYALMRQRKEFVAIPADSWYNFNKDARYKYKQFTLEEAEEKMNKRRKTANGYGRWMMKAPNNGAAALGEVDEKESGVGGGRGCKKATGNDDDEANGEEDEEEESARKNRLGPNRKGAAADDDAEGGDFDFDDDDDDIEKGDDWEHEEIFTDDDENDPEEREDFGPEIPAPPEFKQDEEDEQNEGGLSNSGKELKKLLGRTNGLNESDEEDEISASPILAPKQKDAPKEEPVDNSPLKLISLAPAHGASSSSKSAKGKRKVSSDDAKAATVVPSKKAKTENDVKPVKEEPVSTSKKNAPKKGPSSVPTESWSAVSGPVTEDEIRAVLTQEKPMTTQDLVAKFKSRVTCKEDKEAFALKLKRVSKLHKTTSGKSFVVLREMKPYA